MLWTKTQSSPLEDSYFRCVPYLLGEGQAMQFSVWPRLKTRTRVPSLPKRPPDNYLRDAMVATFARQDVEFDVCLQVQTDPHLMPIEDNAVLWPPELSPRVPAAVLRIPRQTFDSPEQLRFPSTSCSTPGTPSPSIGRSATRVGRRLRMYKELAELRQRMNGQPHYEPTGDEAFPGWTTAVTSPGG